MDEGSAKSTSGPQEELVPRLEPLGDEIVRAYETFGLDRRRNGRRAVEWTFASGTGGYCPFSVVRSRQGIIGMSAYIRARIKLGDAEGIACQAVDSYVSEAARGKGMFTKLAAAFGREAPAAGIDVIWGFPNANAAPAWFGRLGWKSHGQVPFLFKPLRAGYFFRKIGASIDFPITRHRDHNLPAATGLDESVTEVWLRFSKRIGCAIVRDEHFLRHRLFGAPHSEEYRVVVETEAEGAIVASRTVEKHGGKIGYILDAMGGKAIRGLLCSELGRMRAAGADVALAWCFPWSPNYGAYRGAGFLPLPERLRPIEIGFGSRAYSARGAITDRRESWYLSYLDSDGI
jgi:hypothetical protein